MPSRHRAFLWLLLACLLPGCKGCDKGARSAHPRSLPDGTVVLVRGPNGYGAFVLRNQWPGGTATPSPETVDYEWVHRPDGRGTFGTNDPAVRFGVVTGALENITFAGFTVPWSGSTRGLGYVYYPRSQHGQGLDASWAMCVTAETNVAGIRPDDSRWSYRQKPPFSLEREKAWLKAQLARLTK